MDVNDIVNALEGILGLGDTLDSNGIGINTATGGEHTTREVLKTELGQFLMYVGAGGSSFSDGQVELVNLLLSDEYGQIPAWRMKSVADDMTPPDPAGNLSYTAFSVGDEAIAQQNGTPSKQLTDALINLYETFGTLMVAFNENAVSQSRCDSYIRGLKARQSAEAGSAAKTEPAKPAKPAAPKPAPAKKASKTKPKAKTTAPKTKGGKAEFDGMLSFVLPSGYQLMRETDDEGNEKVHIRFGPGKDDNGNDTWEFNPEVGTLEITDAEDDKIPAGESPIETLIRRNESAGARGIMLQDEPKAVLMMRETPINILGRILKYYAVLLSVEKDKHNVYLMTSVKAWDEEDPDVNLTHYRHIIDMISAIRINGKALPSFDKGAEELMEEMTPDFEGKGSIIKGSIGVQIKNGDQVVSESVLVGDDDGTVHTKHAVESKEISNGRHGEIDIKDGWVTKCLKKAVTVEVPEGVIGIEDNAFEKCTKLEKVVLPDGVTSIGSSAFSGCTKLKEITIPDSVNSIGMFAFNECKNLTAVRLPASLTYISSCLFGDCVKLSSVTIPPAVTKIYSSAFQNCKCLTEIKLPEGLEELSGSVFWGCEKLQTIRIPDGIKEIENNLFNECKSLKSVNIPEGVTRIGRFAFSDCEKLESIDIPDSVDEIEAYAFLNCKKIKKITIPAEVTVIDDGILNGCESLTELVLPDDLDRIKDYSFKECKKLKKIKIPSGVNEIGEGAISGCESLECITFPVQIIEIPEYVCKRCSSLKEVIFTGEVESIGEYAFSECTKLAKIELPESLTKIGDGAFNECASLTRIVIPDGVTAIGQYAFDDCDNLKEISMPGHEVIVGGWGLPDKDQAQITFRGDGGRIKNRKLFSTTSSAEDTDESEENGDDLVSKCAKLECICWGSTLSECEDKEVEEIEIPHGITVIGSSAFEGCSKLKSVLIPDTVTEIQMNAFSECSALEEIEIPDSVTKMQGWVFENCTALKWVRLPKGISSIPYSFFRNCKSLMEAEIPEGVTEIEDQAFSDCSSLTDITLPDSIEKIGDWAFDKCDNLETLYLPDKEIEISRNSVPAKTEMIRIPVGDTKAKEEARAANSTERYSKVMPSDEIYSHYGKLKREHDKFTNMGIRHESNNGREHEAIPLTGLMERQGKTDNSVYKKLKTIEKNDSYDLKETALKMAQVFRVEQSIFDGRHDDEGDIGVTMLDKKWKFSALRSFAWTLADMADREGKSIDDYDIDDLLAICRFIKKREWLNYEGGSWFDGLCGHNDIHVYYMPQKMIDDGSAEGICDVFNYNPIVSLDAFRNDLRLLKNPMIRIHNKLLENRDRSKKLDSPEAAVLNAWCSMVMSAETAFFSEDGPMLFFHEYPETPANTKPIPLGSKAAKPKKAAPKAKKEEASAVMNTVAAHEVTRGADGKDRIKLGEYPAGAPITWLVLENNGKDLLLLSEYGLDAKAFNDMTYSYQKTGSFGKGTNEWHNSTLREWLNDEFYNAAFNQEEKGMILEDNHDTYKMSSTGTVEETAPVSDRIFLLSAREVKKYFPTQRDLICKATGFAKEQGAEIEGGPMQCHWWCRSPAVELMPGLPQWVGCIMADGNAKGWGNTSSGVCVRPVIRIRSDAVKNASGAASASPSAGKPAAVASAPSAAAAAEAEAERIRKEATQIIDNVRSDIDSTKSALEKHAENLRKQEEEKEKRMKEAKARGKSDKDETDMLAVLLNEEDQGNLNRTEDEFVEIYAEDFGAYNAAQLKKLRKKVLPKIHDEGFVEGAKEEMLSRSVKDRFSISTGNWFNLSNHWNFQEKGEMAIEKTRIWYRDNELDEVRTLMENHKKEACDSVNRQLSSFNDAWIDFNGVKNDLHIDISETDEDVSPKHSLFDVKLNSRLRVQIILKHPSMGFLTIPVMSLFPSVWNVKPEQIWDAAMNNTMDDSRGVSSRTRTDAAAAKAKALEQIRPAGKAQASKPASAPAKKPVPVKQRPVTYGLDEESDYSATWKHEKKNTPASGSAAAQAASAQGADDQKERQRNHIWGLIRDLEDERDAIKGLFAGMRRNKLQKRIDELKDKLRQL